jgi:hypothetical protein
MAQQSLNNFYLNKYNASLSVKWVINPKDEEEEPETHMVEEKHEEKEISKPEV